MKLLSRSCAEYNINELGLQKRKSTTFDAQGDAGDQEKTYQCASSEMCVFGAIGWGASSVVRKAIHIPTHRILALKKINVFEKASKHLFLHGYYTYGAVLIVEFWLLIYIFSPCKFCSPMVDISFLIVDMKFRDDRSSGSPHDFHGLKQ